jgi:DNA-binding MurR/RpiR family transcriptional regulator
MPGAGDLSSSEILEVVSELGAHISAEEVFDFCLLLMLSEHVFLVGAYAQKTSTRWLASCLEDAGLGLVAVETSALQEKVERNDTVIVVSGPTDDHVLVHKLQPAIASGALLLAIAATSSTRLLAIVDAAITVVPHYLLIRDTGNKATTVRSFTVLSVIAVDAIRAELARRRSSISCPTSSESLPFEPAPLLAPPPKLEHEEGRICRAYSPAAVSRQRR